MYVKSWIFNLKTFCKLYQIFFARDFWKLFLFPIFQKCIKGHLKKSWCTFFCPRELAWLGHHWVRWNQEKIVFNPFLQNFLKLIFEPMESNSNLNTVLIRKANNHEGFFLGVLSSYYTLVLNWVFFQSKCQNCLEHYSV